MTRAALWTLLCAAGCAAPPPPRGVVSLHDTTTEIVVGLGRAEELIAVMEPEFLSPAALAAVEGVPRLSAPVSKEALLAMRPAAVLGAEDVPQHQPELAALPNTTWIDPSGLDGLWRAIIAVGEAIDAPTDAYVAALKARVPAPTPGALRVFVYDCCEPPFTMGGRAPLTELLARLGAKNVFAELDQDWARVSWEAAMVTRPQLIVVDDYNGEGEVAEKIALVTARLGPTPTVTLPLGLALEGPRTLDAIDVLRPAIEAAR
ncbi:ABC transporter substrate-binding protein [Myxococcota bacterium]|nr:ABC transporter substrate-binding protein [Myxococcota bacterium]